MADKFLHEVACPNCLNPIDLRTQSRHVTCDACGSQFLLDGRFCPNCNTYHEEEQSFCQQCGAAIMRVCRRCHTRNWAGNEYCQQCGAAIDIFDLLSMQQKESRQQAEAQRQAIIKNLREQEEEASTRRMAELMAIEAERLAHLNAQRQKQKQNDRRLYVTASVLFLLLFIVIIWLINMWVN